MAQKLEKSKLSTTISLGFHAGAHNAKKIQELVDNLKPRVYVAESADLLETERKGRITATNKILGQCRSNLGARAWLLTELNDEHLGHKVSSFDSEEMNVIISGRRLWLHYVEGYTQEEVDLFTRSSVEQTIKEVFKHLAQGNPQLAIDTIEGEFRHVNSILITRNNQAVLGFELLLEELPEMYPRILGAPGEISILARYGTAHQHLVPMLNEHGFKALAVLDSDCKSYVMELAILLSANPTMSLSEEQKIMLLFDKVYEYVYLLDGNKMEEEKYACMVRAAYEHMGPQRFFEMLRTLQTQASTPEIFEHMLFEELRKL